MHWREYVERRLSVDATREELSHRVVDPLSRRVLGQPQLAEIYWFVRARRKGRKRTEVERTLMSNKRFAAFYWRQRAESREETWIQRRNNAKANAQQLP